MSAVYEVGLSSRQVRMADESRFKPSREQPRGYDEIGKHDGLKIRCSVELVGSNPTIPIQVVMPIPKNIRDCILVA